LAPVERERIKQKRIDISEGFLLTEEGAQTLV